jgi:hypothetical protein
MVTGRGREMDRKALARALRDTAQSASNTIAGNVSGPVDLIAAGLRGVGLPIPQNPVGGSQWMADRGLTAPVEQGAAQVVGDTLGLVGPALATQFAPQIAGVLNQAGANLAAPRTLNPETGAVLFQTGKNVSGPRKDFEVTLPDSPHLERKMASWTTLRGNMDVSFYPVQGGGFAASFRPFSHLSKQKPFVATGDDLDELAQEVIKRLAASDRGAKASATRLANSSIDGRLIKDFGDVFDFKKSERSASQYITHKPSGLKIRISDHDLPLAYEQPDLDLRSSLNNDEIISRIKSFLGQ